MKRIRIVVVALLSVFLITWGVCEAVNRNHYNYAGYVTDVVANEVEFLTPKGTAADSDEEVVSTRRERPQLEAIDDNQLPF